MLQSRGFHGNENVYLVKTQTIMFGKKSSEYSGLSISQKRLTAWTCSDKVPVTN